MNGHVWLNCIFLMNAVCFTIVFAKETKEITSQFAAFKQNVTRNSLDHFPRRSNTTFVAENHRKRIAQFKAPIPKCSHLKESR